MLNIRLPTQLKPPIRIEKIIAHSGKAVKKGERVLLISSADGRKVALPAKARGTIFFPSTVFEGAHVPRGQILMSIDEARAKAFTWADAKAHISPFWNSLAPKYRFISLGIGAIVVGAGSLAVLQPDWSTSQNWVNSWRATEMQKEFMDAALSDEAAPIVALLRNDFDPHERLPNGSTALHYAIQAGAVNVVTELTDRGITNAATRSGKVGWQLAESLGFYEIAALLTESRFNQVLAEIMGAIAADDPFLITYYLERDFPTDWRTSTGATPLVAAIMQGAPHIVDILLRNGASPDFPAANGITPLFAAAVMNNSEYPENNKKIIRSLVQAGANPNAKIDGIPILMLAATANPASIRTLVRMGANPALATSEGVSSADVAALNGHTSLAHLLGGSNISATSNTESTLLSAILADDPQSVQRHLSDESAERTTVDGVPYSVVAAARLSDVQAFERVLARSDISMRGPNGETVLDAVLSRPDRRIKPRLIEAILTSDHSRKDIGHILLSEDAMGQSGLNRMIVTGSSGLVTHFGMPLKLAEDVAGLTDSSGFTPLETAVLMGNSEMVALFMEARVETSGYQPTLQDIARSRGDWPTLASLPHDQEPPDGFELGASAPERAEMQTFLKDRGYFSGRADGVFGAASIGALTAFLYDKLEELRGLAEAGEASHEQETADAYVFTFDHGSWCNWELVVWHNSTQSESQVFVGCTKGNPEWNSYGFGLVIDANGEAAPYLFGKGGWDGSQTLE